MLKLLAFAGRSPARPGAWSEHSTAGYPDGQVREGAAGSAGRIESTSTFTDELAEPVTFSSGPAADHGTWRETSWLVCLPA